MKESLNKPSSPNYLTAKDTYKLFTNDPKDGPIYLGKIGYCDDNTKFCSVENEENLIMLTNSSPPSRSHQRFTKSRKRKSTI